MIENPFVIGEYVGAEYFCDRKEETADLARLITNGNNIVLTAPRRIGKTDLIKHLFQQEEIKREFITVLVDIYSTQNLAEFVTQFGKAITESLRSKGKAVMDAFVNFLYSIRSELTFDAQGVPVWGIGLNYNAKPDVTLDEIFKYIENSSRPCLIAIDEFQQITNYPNGWQVEALLRTYIQQCHNARFIYSGSQRHLMAEMFVSASRPFFMQATLYGLAPLNKAVYSQFCMGMFEMGDKALIPTVAEDVYDRFDGITAYMQKVMNEMYSMTSTGGTCTPNMIEKAINRILDYGNDGYTSLFYQLTQKQRDLILAIADQGKTESLTKGAFIKKYHLPSLSSVTATTKQLLDKDFLTRDKDTYFIYDRLFSMWIKRKIIGASID